MPEKPAPEQPETRTSSGLQPATKESIEFRRPGLRARALSARFARRGPRAEPPRPGPVHPPTSTRALSLSEFLAAAGWRQEQAAELVVHRAGPPPIQDELLILAQRFEI